jgi:agmatinase
LDLEDAAVFDGGDLELCFGDTNLALNDITAYTKEILDNGKLPLMIGGEHLVTLGAVRAVAEKYPDLHIIHFDAHADLRDDYLGATLSHATVLHRVWDIVGDGKIFQFGIRSGERAEFNWGREHVTTHKFDFEGLENVVEKLKGKPVYFTLDLDVLDPSVFPGTGTPEAGGVSFLQLLDAILKVGELDIVGCDINELSPLLDASGASTAVALKVLRELLLKLEEKHIR